MVDTGTIHLPFPHDEHENSTGTRGQRVKHGIAQQYEHEGRDITRFASLLYDFGDVKRKKSAVAYEFWNPRYQRILADFVGQTAWGMEREWDS